MGQTLRAGVEGPEHSRQHPDLPELTVGKQGGVLKGVSGEA